MTPIASRPIWFESFGELTTRWYRDQPQALHVEIGGIAEATIRAEKRAARVLEFCGLQPATVLNTPRVWEVRWDNKAMWNRLSSVLKGWGIDTIRHRGDATDSELRSDALAESDRPSVMVADRAAKDFCETALQAGLLLAMTPDDFATLMLARELYHAASEKLGAPPRPWVDELAEPEFVRLVLGLPFHPLVLRYL